MTAPQSVRSVGAPVPGVATGTLPPAGAVVPTVDDPGDAIADPTSGRALLAGGSILGLAMLVANAGNYALNLLLGRWLTPAQFSDATLMVTLMLTLTSLTLCLQLVAARFVGSYDAAGTPERSDRLARTLRRGALVAGLGCAVLLAAPAVWWREVFHTESWVPFVILGAGMPFYLVQSVGRGVMQGRLRFRPLAVTFVVEMVVRLGLGALLVTLGFGVVGATVGLAASFVATGLVVHVLSGAHRPTAGPRPPLGEVRAYIGFTSVLLVGQMIANNSDVLVAKAYLTPTAAGIFAAVALIGRAVFFLSWSVATVVFPAVAARHAGGGNTDSLLRGGILAVTAIGAVCAAAAWTVGGPVLGVVLGPAYAGLSGLLALYAGMTTLFAVGNLIASHQLSLGNARPSWLLLGGAVLGLVLLLFRHGSAVQLITAQLTAMALLLVVLTVDHLRGARPSAPATTSPTEAGA
ncbi:oligosaccharide flippase family protein [Nakamurella deserti]|uniref:oligosaccharide flippase family protein n=1 Tax=Nakamurella deserti TaxID=2164074 RepID=UPI000DBE4923|nr:oligosaccharide flippase family protein [Nakamurella deserti]